jgi:Flp pilus assembly protein TadG
MRRFWKYLASDQRGSTIILAGLSMVLLMGAAGLVIDGGTLYVTKSQLQKAANAAALSGAQELTGQAANVSAIVSDILQKHKEEGSLVSKEIQMKSSIRLHLQKNVKLGFAQLFGFKSVPVTVQAAAQIQPMGSAVGAAPLGIDDSIVLEYNRPYQLKVDNTGVQSGNFGILALGGPGASTYEDNLLHGYSSAIDIGKVIDTQTGNIAEKTRSSVQARINACPYPPGDYSHLDCARIILIPVYHPVDFTSNQLKQIRVTGFAYFYITDPMDSNDTSIKGMFIQSIGTGFAKPGAVDRGAYSIRLIE